MALKDVDIVSGRLLANSHTAWATSELVHQEEGETDFESMRDGQVIWYLQNISTADSSADTCRTNVPVAAGDRIFIRKNDGSIIDTVVGTVTETSTTCIPNMTSNTEPSGEVLYSSQAFNDSNGRPWHVFANNGTSAETRWSNNNNYYVGYHFENNETKRIVRVKIFHYSGPVGNLTLYGSIDGANWVTLSTQNFGWPNTSWLSFNVESPGDYSYYKLQGYYDGGSTDVQWYDVLMFEEGDLGFEFDTTSITQGETPDQVFRFVDKVLWNGVEAPVADVYYEYGTTGTKMYLAAQYSDVQLAGRQVETKIEFGNAGNETFEIAGKIYKKSVAQGG